MPYIVALVVGAVAAAAVLAFLSLAMFLFQLPISFARTFGVMSLGGGALAAGYFVGLRKRSLGLLRGTKAGLTVLLAVLPFSIAMSLLDGEHLAGKTAAAILCGAVGGVIGVNKDSD
jgi:putative membrane protein (TIGR04086 family)